MTDESSLQPKTREEVDAIVADLRQRLDRLYGERIRGLYLYGSYARGEPRRGSDLDLLVVLDHVDSYWGEIQRTSHDNAEVSLAHGLTISTIFTSEDRWGSADSGFLKRVRQEGRAA